VVAEYVHAYPDLAEMFDVVPLAGLGRAPDERDLARMLISQTALLALLLTPLLLRGRSVRTILTGGSAALKDARGTWGTGRSLAAAVGAAIAMRILCTAWGRVHDAVFAEARIAATELVAAAPVRRRLELLSALVAFAQIVICSTLLGVLKRFVGFGHLLESSFRVGLLAHVGVVLARQLAVGTLDFILGGAALHAESRVIVFELHGSLCSDVFGRVHAIVGAESASFLISIRQSGLKQRTHS
jgi:hypothetical protein